MNDSDSDGSRDSDLDPEEAGKLQVLLSKFSQSSKAILVQFSLLRIAQ